MKKYLALLVMFLVACGQSDGDKVKDANAEQAAAEVEQGSNLIKLGSDQNRHEITTAVGQEVELTLDANATTGYKWNFVTYVSEEDAVEELEEKYVPDDADGKVGVGGKAVYRIKLLKPGDIYVTANYLRGDDQEEDKREEDEYSVKIIVE